MEDAEFEVHSAAEFDLVDAHWRMVDWSARGQDVCYAARIRRRSRHNETRVAEIRDSQNRVIRIACHDRAAISAAVLRVRPLNHSMRTASQNVIAPT